MNAKEMLAKIKNKLKKHAPEIIAATATVVALTTIVLYIKKPQTLIESSDFWLEDGIGFRPNSDAPRIGVERAAQGKICFKIDGEHYSLTPNDCTDEH